MADEIKISELPAVVTPAGSDTIPVVQGGVTKKETVAQMLSGSGAVTSVADTLTVNLTQTGQQISANVLNGSFAPSSASTASSYPLADCIAYTSDYTGGRTTFDLTGNINTKGQTSAIFGGDSSGWDLVIPGGKAVLIGDVIFTNTTLSSNSADDTLLIRCTKDNVAYEAFASNSAAFVDAGFTPTNYSVSNDLVKSHLEGIDTAIGALTSNDFKWESITAGGNTALVNRKGYIANNGGDFGGVLPAIAAVDEVYGISGGNSTELSLIINPGQTVKYGGRTLTNSGGVQLGMILQQTSDLILIVCTAANTTFNIYGSNSAQYLNANHTAVNYTPTNANIDGHLAGLDTAIGPTGVSAGTYTSATITVAADGRISSASNGSSGADINFVELTGSPSTTTLANNTGYVVNTDAPVNFILPATGTLNLNTAIRGGVTGQLWTLENNSGQNIQVGEVDTGIGAGSTISASDPSDQVFIGCNYANNNFYCHNIVGNLLIASSLAASDLPGIKGWYDAENINNGGAQPSDGTALATWMDVSGNSLNLSQGTGAAQPLFKESVFSGKPGVLFDGVNDYMINASFTNTTTNYYVFIVATRVSITNAHAGLVVGYNTASQDYSTTQANVIDNSNMTNNIESYRNGQLILIGSIANNKPFIYGQAFNGTNIYANLSDGSNQITASTASFNQNQLLVGARSDILSTITRFGNFHYHEIIVGNGSLTSFQVNKIMSYLNNKWGIPL